MDEITTDVCVVGGGPAGLTLSLLLLRSGLGVTLVERSATLERHYRGEILQPGGARVLDRLGALEGARARGACPLSGFRFTAGGVTRLEIDYTRLPGPYNYLLSVPQRHVLAELTERCERLPGFVRLAGAGIGGLLTEEGRVTGVVTSGGRTARVRARCVVGADGRYSKTRRLAGIGQERLDAFEHDLLWFRLELPPAERPGLVRIDRGPGGAVLLHDSYPDRVQIAWVVPHGGYAALAAEGVGPIKDELRAALPRYAAAIDEQITRLADLTLLDVFSGCATAWAADGLVLIGDAAHTHGPLGAQGINLAVQDAALLHPLLVEALADGAPDAGALAAFEIARRPDVEKVLAVQLAQAESMFGDGGPRRSPPADDAITSWIAFGNPGITVRTDLFTVADQ
ncbi:FAD-dependent monooxygenase [Actinomadura sp. ATCC 31491]|uniref:FAD-dependent monooxygenase n=1 Tax=Actinomadura luzonensis TaxID=2805427 RepID=A0ABT0G921_9ACTN|nr:FAD-dependent monooxygenase [Actinomadura luzonensis]MCK2221093.1 FAD-dependent monooxygenase [Actinomadura luzonensis]